MKTNDKWAIGGLILGFGLFGLATRKPVKSKRKSKIRRIEFGSGDGDSSVVLPIGGAFIVTYDQTAPWLYQPTPESVLDKGAVELIANEPGFIKFRLAYDPGPEGGSASVRALDENGQVMGAHTFTVFAKGASG